MAVHYIDMDEVCAGGFDRTYLVGKTREISGEDRRGDPDGLGHDSL